MEPARKLEYHLPEPTKQPGRRTKRYKRIRRQPRRLPETALVCVAAIIIVCLAVLYLGQQVHTMHIHRTVQQVEQELRTVRQRHEQLLFAVNSGRSLRAIEAMARDQLGMVDSETSTVLVLDPQDDEPVLSAADKKPSGQPRQPDGVVPAIAAWADRWLPLGGIKAGWNGQ